MNPKLFLRNLSAALFFAAIARSAIAYSPDDPWTTGASVVVHLGLGTAPAGLQDGFTSWNASAADALDIWSGYLDFISISSISASSVPQAAGDGINSAFFSNTVFGESFGEDTLAATVVLTAPGMVINEIVEADVVVNTSFHFNSYRGPEQPGSFDFHRIMLHEFGHVLGLGHVTFDPPGQAIMEPFISDWDHLGADDVAGVRHFYGASISFLPAAVTLRPGDAFTSDTYRPNNQPSSYTATGLSPGLAINSTTGQISGTATTAGSYGTVITAHGPIADAYGAIPFVVKGLDEIPGLLAILHDGGTATLPDPLRARVYTTGQEGLGFIDTNTLEHTTLVPGSESTSYGVSLSADRSTLLYTALNSSTPTEYRIDLNSLAALPSLTIPGNRTAVLEGLNNQAYVGGVGAVDQFDATTGVLQQSFAAGDTAFYLHLALSPDRKTLIVSREVAPGELSTYDVSGPIPVLIAQVTGFYTRPVPSPDGQFVYAIAGTFMGQELRRFSLPALDAVVPLGSDFFYAGLSVSPDGRIYASHDNDDFQTSILSIYDPDSLQLAQEIDPTRLSTDMYALVAGESTLDSSGQRLFLRVSGYSAETWVFSTDFDSFPPPIHPTRNLLNISTRVRIESGENAMIAGLIVQGPTPKKLLLRGLGPSLPITGALSDPALDLYDFSGSLIASNDDWTSQRLDILGTGLAPGSERESALLVTLEPGAYTAVVRDSTNQPGLSLVEAYDLDPKDSSFANISTRGKVGAGDNVMIGGFIIGGDEPTEVLVRAIGPSLAGLGIAFPLADPVLEIHDATGGIISTNDNWRSTQQGEITATGLAPSNDKESAALLTLAPGSYTAIVSGQSGTSGVALVEVYNLDTGSTGSK